MCCKFPFTYQTHFTIISCAPTKNIHFSEAQSQLKKQTCKQVTAVHVERAIKRGSNKEKTGWVWESELAIPGTEKLYKKDLHDPDNHKGLITHLEPHSLECEVKWALRSITMNKARGGDGIPVELFQILKDDAMEVPHSICQQIWKTQQWPQDWKKSVSFQSQRKVIPKNAQTTPQLHSSHILEK